MTQGTYLYYYPNSGLDELDLYLSQTSVLCVYRWSQEEQKVKTASDRGHFVDLGLSMAYKLWGRWGFCYHPEPSCICANIGALEILLTF